MRRYVLGRVWQMCIVLLLASVAIFILLRSLPGDPAMLYAGPDATPEILRAVRDRMGLNAPWPAQYLFWSWHALRGDLGRSYINGYPVIALLAQRMPATLELTAAALLLALLCGISAGVTAAVKRSTPVDYLITTAMGIGLATPAFWLGFILILVFAIMWHLVPASGYARFDSTPSQFLGHLLLPAVTLAVPQMCGLARFVKSALIEAIGQPHVRTARAKGLLAHTVLIRHEIRNGLISVATVVGLELGRLLGGAIIIESVFAWPGVGRLLLDAVLNRDYALLQGGLLMFVAMFMTINLITDLAYGVLDPRIRVG